MLCTVKNALFIEAVTVAATGVEVWWLWLSLDIDAANGKNEYILRDTLAIRILKQQVPRNWSFPRNLILGEQKPGHAEQNP